MSYMAYLMVTSMISLALVAVGLIMMGVYAVVVVVEAAERWFSALEKCWFWRTSVVQVREDVIRRGSGVLT